MMQESHTTKNIIEVSQLAHEIYNKVCSYPARSEYRNAKEVELQNELYALHCAYKNLSLVVDNEPSNQRDAVTAQYETQLKQSLIKLVADCGMMLRGLATAIQQSPEPPDQPSIVGKLDRGGQLHQNSISCVRDPASGLGLDEEEVRRYVDQLKSYNNTTNLIVTTFHWSNSADRTVFEKGMTVAMQNAQQEAANSNSDVKSLVYEILARLDALKAASAPRGNQYGDANINGGYVHQGDVNYYFADVSPNGAESEHRSKFTTLKEQRRRASHAPGGQGPLSFKSPFVSLYANHAGFNQNGDNRWQSEDAMLLSSVTVPQISNEPGRIPSPDFTDVQMSDQIPVETREPHISSNLPLRIMELNNKRRRTGIPASRDTNREFSKDALPSFMHAEAPTTQELEQGLAHIFQPLMSQSARQDVLQREARANAMAKWVHGFDNLLQTQRLSALSSASREMQAMRPELQTASVGLLCSLNERLEGANDRLRTVFYTSSSVAGIDGALDKLLTLTKSVRVEKEVEEFRDERERSGWKP